MICFENFQEILNKFGIFFPVSFFFAFIFEVIKVLLMTLSTTVRNYWNFAFKGKNCFHFVQATKYHHFASTMACDVFYVLILSFDDKKKGMNLWN